MAQILKVRKTGDFQEGSARERWYHRLLEFDGRSKDAFVTSVEHDPPSTPETGLLEGQLEPVAGWLRFFRNEGLLEFEETNESGFEIQTKPAKTGGDEWSEEEVRRVVSDYFAMWHKEQTGQPYNKTKHRNLLIENGLNRSKGSIEFKHQNISAVLLDEGLPYIAGYKPARNYQQLLADIVRQHIAAEEHQLESALETGDLGVDPEPETVDFSGWVVSPPDAPRESSNTRPTRRATKIDYSAREERNRKLGRSGEKIVLEYEVWRLETAGRTDLAEKVRWVSDVDGDGLGYDIRSFDADGVEIFIEVKTTRSGIEMPFLISANEVEVAKEYGEQYRVYRVFNYPKNPQVYVQTGQLLDSFELVPRLFEARPKRTTKQE
ncbi:DUF3883 domain-containing protein [Thioalkalivibrio sp. XN8]|uniref:DUF3883 domain-containing protein n=1 Tax=Thioalkalivibrio sp. XN8 TaxID=2712863 RepID=UPI0013ED275E|nr:DUF3883 domain-containing protein [Thioalkalivibrio sp. XN8]NGP52122.1 DUF3883 domain-containing protein [Thioalkalivibrio sp. XN8]